MYEDERFLFWKEGSYVHFDKDRYEEDREQHIHVKEEKRNTGKTDTGGYGFQYSPGNI